MTKTVLRLSMCVVCAIGALPNAANALLPFENTGNLYVSMWTADEIAVFNANGDALSVLQHPGLMVRGVSPSIQPLGKFG